MTTQNDKKLCEIYKEKKSKAFKKDLDALLDSYEFSGWRRQCIEEQCMAMVHSQIAYTNIDDITEQMELMFESEQKRK